MLLVGLALLAIIDCAVVALYAGKHSEQKLFLRGGADVLAAIVITAGFGVGIVVTIAGIQE